MNWQDQQALSFTPAVFTMHNKMEFYGILASKISLMHKQITCLML